MKHLTLFLAIIFLTSFGATIKAQFVQEAKITYERKINQWKKVEADMDEDDGDQWLVFFKKNNPQYKIDSFGLTIKSNSTNYLPLGEEVTDRNNWWGNDPAARNEVFTNFNTDTRTASKAIFEDQLLITDSIKKLTWKITNETKIIGGFACRKATAKIMDSVYVIAFYTDQIMIPAGPESFSGLPGCILVVSIPRLYTTWQANAIQLKAIKDNEMVVPKTGKKINTKQLNDKLKSSVGKWGKWGQKYIHLINL